MPVVPNTDVASQRTEASPRSQQREAVALLQLAADIHLHTVTSAAAEVAADTAWTQDYAFPASYSAATAAPEVSLRAK